MVHTSFVLAIAAALASSGATGKPRPSARPAQTTAKTPKTAKGASRAVSLGVSKLQQRSSKAVVAAALGTTVDHLKLHAVLSAARPLVGDTELVFKCAISVDPRGPNNEPMADFAPESWPCSPAALVKLTAKAGTRYLVECVARHQDGMEWTVRRSQGETHTIVNTSHPAVVFDAVEDGRTVFEFKVTGGNFRLYRCEVTTA